MITNPASGFLSLGQPTARRMVRRSLASRDGGRTLLVHGPAGAGKRAFVDDLLALVLCAAPDGVERPCNACRGCLDARSRSHPDLVVGSPAAWRERRSTGESIVAVARRWLLDAAGAPIVADTRIVLVEEADRTSEQVQAALLKTLEEPTDRHLFILVADEPSRLLPTIRSRCQLIRVGPVPRAELVEHLVGVRRLPADQAESLALISGGLAGTAVGYADRPDLLAWRRRVQGALLGLLEAGPADRIGAVRDLLDEATSQSLPPAETSLDEDGEPARTPASVQRGAATAIVDAWLDLARDLLVVAAGRPGLAPSGELAPEVARIGSRIAPADLLDAIRRLEQVHAGLRESAAARLALEAAMLAWPRLDR